MRVKLFLAAALIACVCLSACSKRGISSSVPLDETSQTATENYSSSDYNSAVIPDQENSVDEETILIESAEMLTKALAQSTSGLSTSPESSAFNLNPPSLDDPNTVNQFNYLIAAFQGNGYPNSLYSKDFYRDNEGIYHLSEKGIIEILDQVLGIHDFDLSCSNLEYLPKSQEYITGLEFGIGYGGWKCGEIKNISFTPDRNQITVSYRADYLFPGATGNSDEITSRNCEANFQISKNSSGELFLTLLEIAIK